SREIWVQRLTAFGDPIWPEPTVAHSGNNRAPHVIASSSGGVITASYSPVALQDLINIQMTDEVGTAQFTSPKVVDPNARGRQPEQPPAVVQGLSGGIIATWVDTRQDTVVLVKGLGPNGSQWAAGEVTLTQQSTPETYPAAVSDGEGGAIIAWVEPLGPEGTDLIKVTKIDQSGDLVWQPQVIELNSLFGEKRNLQVANDGKNGAYLVWENKIAQQAKAFASRVFSDGQTWGLSQEVVVGNGAQTNPCIISNREGNAIVVWEDDRNGNLDIFAQLFDSTGSRSWDPEGIPISTAVGNQSNPVLVDDGLGGAIITWEDSRDQSGSDIFAQRVSRPGVLGEFRTITAQSPEQNDDWEIGSSQTIKWTASPEIESIMIELTRDHRENYELLFDAIANSEDGQGEIAFEVSGPPSGTCRVRIRAAESPFVLDESELFSISSSKGPSFQFQPVFEINSGDSIFINANATDISGVREVMLNFRLGGAARFDSTQMINVSPDEFRGTIPASFVTERGVEYFLRGQDNIGQRSASDTFFVNASFERGVQQKEIRSGLEQSAYRMISAPNLLAQPLADHVFSASNFGAYDTTSWRLFEFRTSSYVELDSSNFDTFLFSPGKAYWLISASNRTVDFGAGQSRPPDSSAVISLVPGWNQIGQPFAFRTAWSAILEASEHPAVQGPFSFAGAFNLVSTIDPYEGYFVFNATERNIELIVPGVEFDPTVSLAKKNVEETATWAIGITAHCQQARDEFNILGVHPDAEYQWDMLDLPEPPPIGEYVSLYFPRPDWIHANSYTTDYRPSLGPGQVWDFAVTTNVKNSEASVAFRNIEAIPPSLEPILIDERLDISKNLREDNRYTFSTGHNGISKNLKLIIGSMDYLARELSTITTIPTEFQLSQNFPNPFNPSTSIRYGLPRAAKVSLKIFDLLGREVITLIEEESKAAGYHIKTWNGHDRSGRPVASGLYVYRLVAGEFSQTKKMLLVK
ncbi:T9SS type A sorting domain-containing protein, partial [bacterium]|nr:T9SS type A sorting domain-containing protein [bacterium]